MAAKGDDRQRFKRTVWGKEPSAQSDPLRNPDGLYSGMAKRVAIEDGSFCDVGNLPKGGPTSPIRERRK